MRFLDGLRCRVGGHAWVPYGPPPRYADYLPHVVSCARCGAHRFADGTPVSDVHRGNLRPYPARGERESTGWFRYSDGDSDGDADTDPGSDSDGGAGDGPAR